MRVEEAPVADLVMMGTWQNWVRGGASLSHATSFHDQKDGVKVVLAPVGWERNKLACLFGKMIVACVQTLVVSAIPVTKGPKIILGLGSAASRE